MDPNNFQVFMEVVPNRMEQQELRAATTNDLLLQLVDEVRATRQDSQKFQQQQGQFNLRLLEWTDRQDEFNKRQEEFDKRQEQFNERQDQYNIIFLDEIRDIKHDVRDLRRDVTTLMDVVMKQHDERLRKLENFMDGFLRKAG